MGKRNATIDAMIALRNVSKAYGKTTVLSGASLQVKPKDCVCIVGASGSGKTTLAKLLLQMELPTGGSVEVDGIDLKIIPAPILQLFRRRVGIIFQEPVLLEHTTVRENIALPLELAGAPDSVITRGVNDLLKRLDLTSKADLLPSALSLGERTLVGIARAIVTAPMVIIADEPFSNLDAAQTTTVASLLSALHGKGTSIIAFSRDEKTAEILEARMLHLENRVIGSEEAPPKSAAKAATHRLLEVPDVAPEESSDDGEEPKKPTGGNGKKIRITSIGSGLS